MAVCPPRLVAARGDRPGRRRPGRCRRPAGPGRRRTRPRSGRGTNPRWTCRWQGSRWSRPPSEPSPRPPRNRAHGLPPPAGRYPATAGPVPAGRPGSVSAVATAPGSAASAAPAAASPAASPIAGGLPRPAHAPSAPATVASSANCPVTVLVAGIARSGPASVVSSRSTTAASGLSGLVGDADDRRPGRPRRRAGADDLRGGAGLAERDQQVAAPVHVRVVAGAQAGRGQPRQPPRRTARPGTGRTQRRCPTSRGPGTRSPPAGWAAPAPRARRPPGPVPAAGPARPAARPSRPPSARRSPGRAQLLPGEAGAGRQASRHDDVGAQRADPHLR